MREIKDVGAMAEYEIMMMHVAEINNKINAWRQLLSPDNRCLSILHEMLALLCFDGVARNLVIVEEKDGRTGIWRHQHALAASICNNIARRPAMRKWAWRSSRPACKEAARKSSRRNSSLPPAQRKQARRHVRRSPPRAGMSKMAIAS